MRVIIDADPAGLVWSGLDVDDDLALLGSRFLANHGVIDLEGLTVVAGNAPLKHTVDNARKIQDLVGWDVPLHPGISWHDQQLPKPLQMLNDMSPDRQSSDDAARFIINRTMSGERQTLSIVTLGPLSNVARAMELEPKLAENLQQLVMMGGELTGGSKLDLNFILDRAALRTVLKARVQKTMVPIQACAQVAVTGEWIRKFEKRCCPHAAACRHVPKMLLQTKLMPVFVNEAVRSKMTEEEEGRWAGRGVKESWRSQVSKGLSTGFVPWDVVALLSIGRKSVFPQWRRLKVEAPGCEEGEPCGGNMQVLEVWKDSAYNSHRTGNWSGVVHIPTRVNEEQLLHSMDVMLCKVNASSSATVASVEMELGFASYLLAVLFAVAVLLLAMMWACCKCCCSRRKGEQGKGVSEEKKEKAE